MFDTQEMIAIIVCGILIAILLSYFIKYKQKLKSLSNPVRTLNEQEKKHIAPQLKCYSLSLVSDKVYQLDEDKVIFTVLNSSEVKTRTINGLNVIFPSFVDDIILKEGNTFEYIVASLGFVLYAIVITVNGHCLLKPNMTLWDSKLETKI
ncbi:hypothetical protein QJU89_00155 [Pasteurella skyensis]|uniref:Uncharacterized protein n=1 Tax=Phocoenobacter skyensis TaxID=97481 RepID=A0AAJ6NZV7_9PAST|nr:hypothetical protein [Pasteurella skyensis]MDP8161863.1 hypothetical protein [Pasteurella skyensis]MDP8172019.1 hypothetical protein [Pasteurella skyensis]MDP8176254.1 hypothetical protein [Pasteurella skyensis]MDP8178274.1 hypothetical protein [Pasteurella skyensis]MDP8182118.1 hypothetical protein [Pasteurella skyensis]